MEPISSAAAAFATNLVKRRAIDWVTGGAKLRRIRRATRGAYSDAASAAIDNCGLSTSSAAWLEVSELLADPEKAQQLASLIRQGAFRPAQMKRELRVKHAATEQVLWDFMAHVSTRLIELIPSSDRASVEVILNAVAALNEKLTHRLYLTRFEHRRQGSGNQRGDGSALSAYARSIPFLGRHEYLEDLRRWLDSSHSISARVLVGDGGRGKTRMALAICEEIAAKGWHAGFLGDEELRHLPARTSLRRWEWQQPTLIVVDYAAQRARELNQWLVALADHPARRGKVMPPLRVLMLERSAATSGGWWTTAFGVGGADAADTKSLLDPLDPVEVLPIEDNVERWAFAERSLSEVIQKAPAGDDIERVLLVAADWGSAGDPLTIMMAALAVAAYGESATPRDRATFARELAKRERERINANAKAWAAPPALVAHLVAYATLAQGLSPEEARGAATAEAETLGYKAVNLPDVISAAAGAYGAGNEAIDSIIPDLIGEAFLLETWPHDVGCSCVIRCAEAISARRVGATVVRTAQDYSAEGVLEPLAWINTLVAGGFGAALLNILDDTARETVALRGIVVEIAISVLSKARTELEQEDTVASRVYLANLLNNLSNRLSDLGDRHEDALATVAEAVAMRRDLSHANPDLYRYDLAGSLSNLAVRLSAVGRLEEALAPSREAVEICRDLASGHPDRYRLNLAASLNNLASHLSNVGRNEDALAVAEEAVEVYRDLAASQSDAARAGLAGSLANLSARLADLARHQDAHNAGREAVKIYRALATARPDAHRPHLAAALNNFALNLGNLGLFEQALATTIEAVAIRRELAIARPDAFQPDLATSLHNLANQLSELKRREEALEAAREAVELRRNLAERNSDAFRPQVAVSLLLLANRLGELGQSEAGCEAAAEAVSIYRELMATRGGAFPKLLASALDNLANRLSELGRLGEALNAAAESVSIHRNAPAQAASLRDAALVGPLHNLANRLGEMGRYQEAFETAAEAVAIYRELVIAQPQSVRPHFAMALRNLANHLHNLGLREQALETVEESVRIYRELHAERPAIFAPTLASSVATLARLLKAVGRNNDSLTASREAEDLLSGASHHK